MAKSGLTPHPDPQKNLLEVRAKRFAPFGIIDQTPDTSAASGYSEGREMLSGEVRDQTSRWTSQVQNAANHHGEIPGVTSKVWQPTSDTVQAGSVPKVSGPNLGRPSAAAPLGTFESLEES
jgi:hypothetical protein